MNIRDELCKLGATLDRLGNSHLERAKIHALQAMDGDLMEDREARVERAKSQATLEAMKLVDELRQKYDLEQRTL